MARTTKYCTALVDALCRILEDGNTRRCACAAVGIDNTTFYAWLKERPAFSRAVAEAESRAEQRYLHVVSQAASSGDLKAAQWWLERRTPEYRQRQQIDVTNLSDDDLLRALEALEAASATEG